MGLAADAPNVADWISAIGQATGSLFTAAAVIVALWIALRDRKWRRADLSAAEAERRAAEAAAKAELEDRTAQQARLVTSLCEFHDFQQPGGDAETEYEIGDINSHDGPILVRHIVWVSIINGSAEWIFDPQLLAVRGAVNKVTRTHVVFIIENDGFPKRDPTDMLGPGEVLRCPVVCEGENGKLIGAWMHAEAEITYVDNKRRPWARVGAALPIALPPRRVSYLSPPKRRSHSSDDESTG